MKSLDLFFIRLFQFMTMSFFTFVVFFWFSITALIPLAVWYHLIGLLSGIFGPIFSSILSLVFVCAVMIYLIKIPNLLETFLSAGNEIAKLGYACVKRLGALAESVKADATPTETKVEIILKDKLS